MDLKALAESVASEAKSLADDIRAAATGTIANDVVTYLPSFGPFLKIVASDAAMASNLLGMVPAIEQVIAIAQALGARPATGDELADLEKDHAGYSAD